MSDLQTIEQLKKENRELRNAGEYLLKFVPPWAREVPRGLFITFYGTLSYDGDLAVKEKVDNIIKVLS